LKAPRIPPTYPVIIFHPNPAAGWIQAGPWRQSVHRVWSGWRNSTTSVAGWWWRRWYLYRVPGSSCNRSRYVCQAHLRLFNCTESVIIPIYQMRLISVYMYLWRSLLSTRAEHLVLSILQELGKVGSSRIVVENWVVSVFGTEQSRSKTRVAGKCNWSIIAIYSSRMFYRYEWQSGRWAGKCVWGVWMGMPGTCICILE